MNEKSHLEAIRDWILNAILSVVVVSLLIRGSIYAYRRGWFEESTDLAIKWISVGLRFLFE